MFNVIAVSVYVDSNFTNLLEDIAQHIGGEVVFNIYELSQSFNDVTTLTTANYENALAYLQANQTGETIILEDGLSKEQCINLMRAGATNCLSIAQLGELFTYLHPQWGNLATFAPPIEFPVTSQGMVFIQNSKFEILYGRDAEYHFLQAEGSLSQLLQKIYPDDKAHVEQQWNALITGEQTTAHYQSRMLHPSGYYLWLENYIFAMRSADGEPLYYVSYSCSRKGFYNFVNRLKTNEQYYRMLFGLTKKYAYVHSVTPDNQLITEWLSTELANTLKLDTNTVVDNTVWFRVIHEDDVSLLQQAASDAITEQTQQLADIRLVKVTGELMYTQIIVNPYYDTTEERVTFLYGGVRDFTEKNVISRELETQSSLLQLVINTLPVAMFLYDKEGTLQMHGGKLIQDGIAVPKGQIGQRLQDVYESTNWRVITAREALKGKKIRQQVEIDGRYMDVFTPPVINDNEDIIGVARFGYNITDLVEVQQSYEQTNRLLEDMSNSIDEAFWVYNPYSRRISYTNRAFDNFFQHPTTDDMTWAEALLQNTPEDSKYIIEDMFYYMENITTRKKMYEFQHRDPESSDLLWFRVTIYPVFNDDGTVAKYTGTVRDVTLENMLKQELITNLKKERELNDRHSRFVSTISHEFRTPLQGILSSSNILRKRGMRISEEKRMRHFSRIDDQVKNLTNLLETILEKGEYDHIAMNSSMELVNVIGMLEDIISEYREINPDYKFDSNLNGIVHIPMSLILLKQAFGNLISNAVKYSPSNSTIAISKHMEDDWMVISISDNGIGIPEEDIEHIFEPFQRSSNTSGTQGTGLGLFIVKDAITRHGGWIECASEVSVGTTFKVGLPINIKMNKDTSHGKQDTDYRRRTDHSGEHRRYA